MGANPQLSLYPRFRCADHCPSDRIGRDQATNYRVRLAIRRHELRSTSPAGSCGAEQLALPDPQQGVSLLYRQPQWKDLAVMLDQDDWHPVRRVSIPRNAALLRGLARRLGRFHHQFRFPEPSTRQPPLRLEPLLRPAPSPAATNPSRLCPPRPNPRSSAPCSMASTHPRHRPRPRCQSTPCNPLRTFLRSGPTRVSATPFSFLSPSSSASRPSSQLPESPAARLRNRPDGRSPQLHAPHRRVQQPPR